METERGAGVLKMGGLLPPQALVIDKNVRQEWRFHHIAAHLLCIVGLKGFGIWTFSFGDVGEQINAVLVCAQLTTTVRPLSIRLVCVLRLKIRREQSRHFLLDAVKSGT